jgi:hypothetical protein
MFDSNVTYHIFDDFNIPFDEKGSTCGTLRRVQWVKDGEEPDESKAKLELRKIYINSSGERTGKGYTFSTPEGPSELTIGLIENGFGNTKDILKSISKRSDFKEVVENFGNDDDDNSSGEVFDMRDLLLNISSEDDESEDDYNETA